MSFANKITNKYQHVYIGDFTKFAIENFNLSQWLYMYGGVIRLHPPFRH